MFGWIRWDGGKCPVEELSIVDVKHRDGDVFTGVLAMKDCQADDWEHRGHAGDIISYRKSNNKPEKYKEKSNDSGWINVNGVIQPVEDRCIVEVMLRSGEIEVDFAYRFLWRHLGGEEDAIAYRLHNQDAATSEQPKQDMVNHPPHYQSDNGVECIDAIRAALGRDGFIAYCRGNAMKYIWRDKLDNVEDWNKAVWYLNKAIEAKSE